MDPICSHVTWQYSSTSYMPVQLKYMPVQVYASIATAQVCTPISSMPSHVPVQLKYIQYNIPSHIIWEGTRAVLAYHMPVQLKYVLP